MFGCHRPSCAQPIVLAACLAFPVISWAQAVSPPQLSLAAPPIQLLLNKPIERALTGGKTDVFTVNCTTGEIIRVVAEQKGIDVVVTILNPTGNILVEADSPNGTEGPEPASVICSIAGNYSIRVNAGDPAAAAGKYEIRLQELQQPSTNDLLEIEAEQAAYAGQKLQGDHKQQLQAAELYAKAVGDWILIGDKYEAGLWCSTLGILWSNLGNYPKALDRYNQALALSRDAGDSRGEVTALNLIGRVYDDQGQKQKALDFYNRALPIERKANDRREEAITLNNIGALYRVLGQEEKALDIYNDALQIRREVGDRSGEATTLNNIGLVYDDLGQKQKALDFYNQALPIEHETNDRNLHAATLTNMGAIYSGLGQMQKALDFDNQALAIARELRNRKRQEVLLCNIGVVYDNLGEWEKALDFYNQGLSIERELGIRDGTTLSNIGVVYGELGQQQKALDFYNQALLIEREAGNRSGESIDIVAIGVTYQELGQYQKALDFYNQALPVFREIHNRYGEASTLDSMGTVYYSLGQFQQALDSYNQALPIFSEVGSRSKMGNILLNVGAVLDALGDVSGSLHSEIAALSLSKAVDEPSLQGSVDAALMSIFHKQHRLEAAMFFGQNAVNCFQQMRKNISGLDKELRADFLQSKSATYRELAELLVEAGRLDEAEKVLDLLKTAELSETVRGVVANNAGSTAGTKPFSNIAPQIQVAIDEQLANAGELTEDSLKLGRLQRLPTPSDADRTTMASLTAKIAARNADLDTFFHEALTAKLQSAINIPASLDPDSLSGLIPRLGPGVVALYTLVGKKQSYVIVATTAGLHQRVIPISQDLLDKSVAQLRISLRSPGPDTNANLQAISHLLLDPIAEDIATAAKESPDHIPTLLWSLDGSLRYIPLNALFDPQQKPGHRYLVERARNIIITPESRAHLLDPPASANLSVAAFGLSRSYDGLPALVNVDRELHAIVKTPQSSTAPLSGELLHNDAFTLTALESSLKENFSVVHIASHFVFKPGDSGDSYLLLGGETTGGAGYELTLLKLDTDPALSFTNTRLLTLSACSTAASDTASNGREMDSLGMVMQQRGAAAVLATLWDVNDSSTSLLMSDFYRRWAATPGIAKIEALRQAQIAMLHGTTSFNGSNTGRGTTVEGTATAAANYAHPYYWAPFVLIGNFR